MVAGGGSQVDGGEKPDGDAKTSAGPPLESSRAERSVWLLKLPANVGTAWQQMRDAKSTAPLARLTMSVDPLKPEAPPQYTMDLPPKDGVPGKTYTLNLTKDLVPMHIFSENEKGRLMVEGKVEHKFDMKPRAMDNDEYRKICRERMTKSMVKTRTLQVLSNDRGGFMNPMPMSTFPLSGSKDKKRPAVAMKVGTEGKRIRRERSQLEDSVFKLFERQPNWALKQLVQETDQPVAFLKEVLNDLCIYNKRGVNQGTYELKPEYIIKTADDPPPAAL